MSLEMLTIDDLKASVKKSMQSSSTKIEEDSLELACYQALAELNWTLPQSDLQKCFWIINRAKRHALNVLMTEAAHKFRYKDIHLHNRFKHYHQLIEMADKEFLRQLESGSTLFDTDKWPAFIDYLDNGFVYDYLGHEYDY